MTSKEYLQQIQRLNDFINQRTKEKEELRSFDGTAAIDYSKDRVQTSPKGDAPYVSVVECIIEIENEIVGLIEEYVNLKHKIIGEIQAMTNSQYANILYKKYVEFKRLEVIAVEMNYSYDYIKHAHGYALQEFGNQFLKDSTQ